MDYTIEASRCLRMACECRRRLRARKGSETELTLRSHLAYWTEQCLQNVSRARKASVR